MIINALQQTLLVTGFVLSMMMLIEYLNTITRGNWTRTLHRNKLSQVALGTLLGVTPGCFGTFTAVSLFTHKFISFGALVAALIATIGDEAFMMLALIPRQAIWLVMGIGALGFVVGMIVDLVYKKDLAPLDFAQGYALHADEPTNAKLATFDKSYLSWQRLVTVLLFVFFIIAPFVGLVVREHHHIEGIAHAHHHHSIDWISILFAIFAGVATVICLLSSKHFVHDHVWGHLIKRHFLKIFLWTLGAMLLILFLQEQTDLNAWVSDNVWIMLLIAICVGIIPQSGPHLVFLALYINGGIPLGVLVASSIVQDGHGSLPLFAESKSSFLWAKLINMAVGLVVGAAFILLGN